MNTTTSTLRNYSNGKYLPMFNAAGKKSTEQLKDALLLSEAMQMTSELSLSRAVMVEILEERGESQFVSEFLA